jgi:flagellar basal body rod protein FlgC
MSFSTSWTQPYLPTNYNPFYQPSPEHAATEEMIRINAVDKIVAEMTDYPDAERMLRKIME